MMRSLGLFVLCALPASAEVPLSGTDFAAHVGTDTITYDYSTGTRGTAEYGPNNTLRWAFRDGPCLEAQWFARNDEICFAYADGRLSACWQFFLDGNSLRGTATELGSGSTEPLEIREAGRSSAPLDCPGPDVGV